MINGQYYGIHSDIQCNGDQGYYIATGMYTHSQLVHIAYTGVQ